MISPDDILKSIAESVSGMLQFAEGNFVGLAEAMPEDKYSLIVEDYIRPAAIAAGVLEERDGQVYYDGEVVIRFGFHSLRHGLQTWLAEQGTDPAVIPRMLRPQQQGH